MVAGTRFRVLTPIAFALAALTVLAAPAARAQDLSDPTLFYGIQWQIRPNPACVEQNAAVLFTACRCNVELLEAGTSPTEGVYVKARVQPDIVCVHCDPDTLAVPLGQLAAGHHEFLVTAHATVVSGDSTLFEAIHQERLQLEVYPTCPPPLPGNPPMVETVQIGRGAPCPECPARACSGDSIPVFLSGYTPDTCTEFAGVEVIPSLTLEYPSVPSLRVHFRTASCLGAPCALVLTPWSALVRIPPLPERLDPPYQLLVESDLWDICLPDTQPVRLGGKNFAFTVEACSLSTPACFEQDWVRADGSGSCHATVGEGAPARLQMGLRTSRAIAALEGNLRLEPTALRITDITPVGVAASMKVDWIPTEFGARFVLFTVDGSSIPAGYPRDLPPILEIEVSGVPDVPIPEVTQLFATELSASDEFGQSVPPCPTVELMMVLPPRAYICRSALCDMNGDGGADVRDLVLLVRCVLEEGPCPDRPSGGEPLDCDGDGSWEVEDVFCCARVVLNGGAPDSASGPPDPAVAVSLGAPATGELGDLRVPVLLDGADRLGAARLALSYPSDRYEVDDVVFPESDPQWIALSETTGDRITVGFVGLQSGDAIGATELSAEVRLRLRPGQTHGGELTLEDSEFAGRDGAAHWQGEDAPSVPLAPFVGVQLAAPHPNPFQQAVRFSVQLSQATTVEIGVYDASGRRVAQLYRGLAEAGAFDLEWNGRAADGSLSPSGVYWLRATAAGVTTTSKVLFLRGD